MQKTTYESYKYTLQDTSRLYVGAKYTFAEILENEDILFKFRLATESYILKEDGVSPEDTLETHLYYLSPDAFLVKIYDRLKAKIKVNVIEEKKNLFGKRKKQYVTKTLSIKELVAMMPEEKQAQGLVIQELCVSKLALAGL